MLNDHRSLASTDGAFVRAKNSKKNRIVMQSDIATRFGVSMLLDGKNPCKGILRDVKMVRVREIATIQ